MYDVIIAGAGPAGSSAAIHLAQGGAHVALLEQKKFPRPKLCGEFISPECLDHFKKLGVLEQMHAKGGVNLEETVFYSRGGRSVNVPSAWFGAGGLALGLSRAEMDENLLQRARSAGVEVFEETTVTGPIEEAERIRGVRAKRGAQMLELAASLVLDATGSTRALARQIEKRLEVPRDRPRFVAFKAHFENTAGAKGACEIYSYRGGYGGLNSVEQGLSNLCFIVAADDVRALGSHPDKLVQEVVMSNKRAAATLRDARLRSEWLSVALDGYGRRSLVPAEGLLSIGDAAAFIDPFTGSGMLMALEGGELAAEIIATRLRSLSDTETFRTLAADYRERHAAHFRSRLMVCSLLRRVAFVPRLADAAIVAFGLSARLRRRFARATRHALGEARD